MADENKIQFDVELNEGSINSSFGIIDKRAAKSAEDSAAVFQQAFENQEKILKESINKMVDANKKLANKSAAESAEVFQKQFEKQNQIYKASVKQNIDNAINAITGGNTIKKSAQESASAFEEAFAKEAKKTNLSNFFVSQNTRDVIANTLKPKSLTDITAGLYLAKQAFDVLKSAAVGTFNFILEGESKIKLEKRFEALAASAGIAGSAIKDQLTTAVKGLVDDDQLLQVSSEAFVRLGSNAAKLPQVLELARKTYKVFGGDVISNSESIIAAVESGNKKQLRSVGLYTDLDKAVKSYARQIGTVPELLTEAQVEQARLNAILEVGNQRFGSIKAESLSANEETKRLSVSFKELGDQLSVLASNAFSDSIAQTAKSISTYISGINEAIDKNNKYEKSSVGLEEKITSLTKTVNETQTAIDNLNAVEALLFKTGYNEILQKNTAELDKYKNKLNEVTKAEEEQAKARADKNKNTTGDNEQNSEELLRRRRDLAAKIVELNQQVNQSEIQLAQEEFARKANVANFEKLNYEQRKAEVEKYQLDVANLEKFYRENGVANETLRQQGREALESAHVNRLLQIQQNYAFQREQLFDQTNTKVLTMGDAFNNVMKGIEESAQETSVNASKSFKNLGKTMLQSIGQASGNAFAAFGQAVATGEDALSAFGKSLLNSLGQMAIQVGTQFILQGIAYQLAGLANGGPLIAAGAALAAFGGILSASGGAGPRDVSGGGGTAGDGIGAIADNPINDPIAPEDTKPETPKTILNLTVNGNILDRRQTGLELAEVLQEQFGDQGLVIQGVG